MPNESTNELKKTIGLRDLVLLNIATIIGLSTLPQVAQFGFGSLVMYLIAIVLFFIPSGLMVAELSHRIGGTGGFYNWIKEAFGPAAGFIAAWCYWLSNIVWLPTVLLLISTSAVYLLGNDQLSLIENQTYIGLSGLAFLWLIIGLNILGMEKAKWIQNLGGIAIWLSILLIVGLGFTELLDSPELITKANWIPDFTNWGIIPFFAAVAFAFGGLELAPVMGGEIKNPSRNIPNAIVLTSISVGLIYILGTLGVLVLNGSGEVNVIDGVAQAFYAMSQRSENAWLGLLGVLFVLFGVIGQFGSWLTGIARLPYAIGVDSMLPSTLSKLHPAFGTPYVSLIWHGVILTIFLIGAFIGSTVQDAFLVLFDMAIILYFIPFIFMFGALIFHVKKNTGNGVISFFQHRGLLWLTASLGTLVMIIGIVLACVPSGEVENQGLFYLKVIGGSAILIAAGWMIVRRSLAE